MTVIGTELLMSRLRQERAVAAQKSPSGSESKLTPDQALTYARLVYTLNQPTIRDLAETLVYCMGGSVKFTTSNAQYSKEIAEMLKVSEIKLNDFLSFVKEFFPKGAETNHDFLRLEFLCLIIWLQKEFSIIKKEKFDFKKKNAMGSITKIQLSEIFLRASKTDVDKTGLSAGVGGDLGKLVPAVRAFLQNRSLLKNTDYSDLLTATIVNFIELDANHVITLTDLGLTLDS